MEVWALDEKSKMHFFALSLKRLIASLRGQFNKIILNKANLLKAIIILFIMVANSYPLAELTRCIIQYNTWGDTLNWFSNIGEIIGMYLFYFATPLALLLLWKYYDVIKYKNIKETK